MLLGVHLEWLWQSYGVVRAAAWASCVGDITHRKWLWDGARVNVRFRAGPVIVGIFFWKAKWNLEWVENYISKISQRGGVIIENNRSVSPKDEYFEANTDNLLQKNKTKQNKLTKKQANKKHPRTNPNTLHILPAVLPVKEVLTSSVCKYPGVFLLCFWFVCCFLCCCCCCCFVCCFFLGGRQRYEPTVLCIYWRHIQLHQMHSDLARRGERDKKSKELTSLKRRTNERTKTWREMKERLKERSLRSDRRTDRPI